MITSTNLKIVIDGMDHALASNEDRRYRCYIQGSAHIHGKGLTPYEAVGDMVLQNPLAFGCQVVDHLGHSAYGDIEVDDLPMTSHPDHQMTGHNQRLRDHSHRMLALPKGESQ